MLVHYPNLSGKIPKQEKRAYTLNGPDRGKEKVPYGIERYTNESKRLYGVLEKRLEGRDYIADEYSIADMACYPWIVAHESHGQNLEEFKNINAWYERISKRPAVRKAYL